MKAVLVQDSVDLAAPVDAVWPLLSDTNRLNHAMGLNAMRFDPLEGGGSAARMLGETSVLGLRVRFEEMPFEWSWGKTVRSVRRMRGGPLVAVDTAFALAPLPRPAGAGKGDSAGTRLTVRIGITPRWAALRPAAWLFGKHSLSTMLRICRGLDAHILEQAASPLDTVDSRPNEEVVASAVAGLTKAGVATGLADRLGAFVREAPDFDLVRIRPFELAERWGEGEVAVLHALLHAVPAGLVELRWAIVCPSCRTASEEANSLDQISLEGHCHLCDISFAIDLDRAVEATFIPHPSARAVTTQMFCSGGPARVPHVLSQIVLAPGEAKELDAPREAARYRVFARGGASASVEVAPGGAARAEAKIEGGGVQPADLRIAPEGVVRVENASAEPRHVKLERLGYATKAATAHVVSTMPEFRSLFSSHLLKPGTPLKVSRAAILFSDLTGSTALYSKVGDAAAFRLVDDHFDLLRDIVRGENGAFVKTMGDAVMAAFVDERAAVRAGLEALTRFESWKKEREHGDAVGIKLGINAGACYVVTANGALDYFGQTVNVASRVQHLADSGELVLARASFEALPPEERAKVVVGETFEARVKGVEAPLSLVRLRVRSRGGSS